LIDGLPVRSEDEFMLDTVSADLVKLHVNGCTQERVNAATRVAELHLANGISFV
jgi:hypothetical protein